MVMLWTRVREIFGSRILLLMNADCRPTTARVCVRLCEVDGVFLRLHGSKRYRTHRHTDRTTAVVVVVVKKTKRGERIITRIHKCLARLPPESWGSKTENIGSST